MKKMYEKMKLYTILFIFGASLYCLLELIYGGRTHFSVGICGGVSLMFIYFINSSFAEIGIIRQGVICALFITACELLCGIVVNMIFKMDVWDYSIYKWNFYGQICLSYSAVWFVLSILGIYLCKIFKKCLE